MSCRGLRRLPSRFAGFAKLLLPRCTPMFRVQPQAGSFVGSGQWELAAGCWLQTGGERPREELKGGMHKLGRAEKREWDQKLAGNMGLVGGWFRVERGESFGSGCVAFLTKSSWREKQEKETRGWKTKEGKAGRRARGEVK